MTGKKYYLVFAIFLINFLCGVAVSLASLVTSSWIWVPMCITGAWTTASSWYLLKLLIKVRNNDRQPV